MGESGHILVADDEETVLRTTAALLGEEGYECDIARDACEVRDLLDKGDYDLLIADWKMPGNVNLEIVHAVEAAGRRVPVIVITGYPQLGQAVRAQGLTVFEEILKPYEFEDLLDAVRRGVEAGRAARPAM